MGPQLDSCGKRKVVNELGKWIEASMGPQLDSCGKPPLQHGDPALELAASMGPQLDSCGKRLRVGAAHAQIDCFNGAAT